MTYTSRQLMSCQLMSCQLMSCHVMSYPVHIMSHLAICDAISSVMMVTYPIYTINSIFIYCRLHRIHGVSVGWSGLVVGGTTVLGGIGGILIGAYAGKDHSCHGTCHDHVSQVAYRCSIIMFYERYMALFTYPRA